MILDAHVHVAAEAADMIAHRLAVPEVLPAERRGRDRSLAQGAVGIALLHIERAHTGAGTWHTAHAWLTAATDAGYDDALTSGLYLDVPALAFAVHTAGADGIDRYQQAREALDARVTALAHRRVDAAHARIDRGQPAAFAEYDLLHGLTGIGAHLLHHHPGSDALGRILTYLIRLTQPLRVDGEVLPGWWVHHDPNLDQPATSLGGHANLGIAHGITGPLALLSLALRRRITVPGHVEAVAVISAWLDRWRQHTGVGAWWPQWITRADLRAGRPTQAGPGRPSWCYGTPGIARAQQLAAIATHDPIRQRAAEHALDACLNDPVQLRRITDTGLCHGWAGVHHTAWRAAADALTPHLHAHLPHLRDQLLRHHRTNGEATSGLLDGDAGVALALHTTIRSQPPVTGWDTCLLA